MIDPIKTPKQIALEMAGILPHMSKGKRVAGATEAMQQYIAEMKDALRRRRQNLATTSHKPAGPFAAVQREDYVPEEIGREMAPTQQFIDRPTPSPIATPRGTSPDMLSTPSGRLQPVQGVDSDPRQAGSAFGSAGRGNQGSGLLTKEQMAYPHMTRRGTEADPFLYKEATGETPASTTSRGGEGMQLQDDFREYEGDASLRGLTPEQEVGSEIEGGYAMSSMYDQLASQAAKAEREGALHNYSPYDQAFLVANREALRKALGKQKYEQLMERAGLWRTGERTSAHTRDVSADIANKPSVEFAEAMERYRSNPRKEDQEMLQELLQGIMRRKDGGSTTQSPTRMRDYLKMVGKNVALPGVGVGLTALEVSDFMDSAKRGDMGAMADQVGQNAAFFNPLLAGIYTMLTPREANAGEDEVLYEMKHGKKHPAAFMREWRGEE